MGQQHANALTPISLRIRPMYESLDDLWALPRTRQEALALGKNLYFTGIPCKNGHLAPRGTGSNRACRACNKINYDKWRKNNPDKAREASNTWKNQNKDRVITYRQADYAQKADYYKSKACLWRSKNTEKAREATRNWFKSNPHKRTEYEATRRSRITNCTVNLTAQEKTDIENIYAKCQRMNKKAGKIAFHVDHIKPLSKGGLHHPSNLQILTAQENVRKHDHWDEKEA